MRYLAEAPLATLRADLGLEAAVSSHISVCGPVDKSAPVLKNLLGKLKVQLEQQQQQIADLRTELRTGSSTSYVQNLNTLAIHGVQ